MPLFGRSSGGRFRGHAGYWRRPNVSAGRHPTCHPDSSQARQFRIRSRGSAIRVDAAPPSKRRGCLPAEAFTMFPGTGQRPFSWQLTVHAVAPPPRRSRRPGKEVSMWWVPAAKPRTSRRPLLAALGFGLVAIVACLGVAGSALAADPSIPPLVAGQHVYDYGNVLSAGEKARAETLASDIEAHGGGRVVVYFAADLQNELDASQLEQALEHRWAAHLRLHRKRWARNAPHTQGQAQFQPAAGRVQRAGQRIGQRGRLDAELAGSRRRVPHQRSHLGRARRPGRGHEGHRPSRPWRVSPSQLNAPVYVDISLGKEDASGGMSPSATRTWIAPSRTP